MIIKQDELKTIILYLLKPYFDKYGFKYVKSKLKITDKIYLYIVLDYNNHNLEILVSFLIDYKDDCIVFKDIDGKVSYSFIEMTVMQLIKQFIKVSDLVIGENECFYYIKLPINSIVNKDNKIEIKIRD